MVGAETRRQLRHWESMADAALCSSVCRVLRLCVGSGSSSLLPVAFPGSGLDDVYAPVPALYTLRDLGSLRAGGRDALQCPAGSGEPRGEWL